MYTKKGFPEVGEFVICTVDRLAPHSGFAKLDEYSELEGMIPASELSRRWVRNVKSYLKIGSKLVCKVLDIDKEKKHINLSVRRVGVSQERAKNKEIKEENTAYNLLRAFGEQINISEKQIYAQIGEKIIDSENLLYPVFLDAMKEKSDKSLVDLGIDKKLSKSFLEFLENRLQVPKAVIEECMKLRITSSDGLNTIKEAIKKAKDIANSNKVEISIKYFGAPKYNLSIIADDFSIAEKTTEEIEKSIKAFMQKNNGSAEFERLKN